MEGLIARLLPHAGRFDAATLEAAPAAAGAYVLAIRLDDACGARMAGRAAMLPAGAYAYAGSAHGPGGLRARLRRHFRAGKRPHWHVDWLTLAAAGLAAWAVPGGAECDLLRRLLDSGRFAVPLPGFGSSDCPACPAHLLAWTG